MHPAFACAEFYVSYCSLLAMNLKDLRSSISRCNRCGKNNFWNFPTIGDVKGFFGAEDYIFVATQPHLGEFPKTQNDRRLYVNMKKYGFNNAHLTDVVKCRGRKFKELTKTEVDNCIKWFDKEVRIVKPKVIIALGKKAFDVLIAIDRFKPLLGLTHYSARISDDEYEKEFEALRYFLDSYKYQHGMRIKDFITEEQRKLKETMVEYKQFVQLLNELLREKKISAESRRDYDNKWRKQPETRTIILERLRRLQEG